MKTINQSDPSSISPLMKWGIDVSKMRRKAFDAYVKNYNTALSQWPEFREEYDYQMQLSGQKPRPKPVNKGIRLAFFFTKKNFLKHMLFSRYKLN